MIHFARGPFTREVSQEEAIEQIKSDPRLAKGAEVAVIESGGRWLAAISEPTWTKEADGNPFGGPEKDDSEDSAPAGPPKDEGDAGPDDAAGPDGPPSDDGGEGGPPKGDKEHGEHGDKGGDKAVLHELLGIVTQMAQALGIAPPGGGPEESAVPGEEMAPPPPGPPGPPHGHAGPPGAGGPPPGPGGPDQTVQHQRALKPGEAPPGTTPVGAPAFASVADDHPWKDQIGKTASFTVAEVIPENMLLSAVDNDLKRVAFGTEFKVKQVAERRNAEGQREAAALISAY